MFGNLGMSEIMIIAVIALIVLGPEKFPEYAKIALRAYRDFRGYIDDIKHEMANELKPVKDEIQELSRHNPEEYVENLAKAISAVDDEKKTSPAPETTTGETEAVTEESHEEDTSSVPAESHAEETPAPSPYAEAGTTPAHAVEVAEPAEHPVTPERLDG